MIQTAGGTFDRREAPIYFAAGQHNTPHYPKHVLIPVNELMSKGGEKRLVELLDAGHSVLLDSGVFWLTNEHKRRTGMTMDEALGLPPEEIPRFDQLFDRYVYLTKTYGDRLWGYIELDQGGSENKTRTRRRLHDLGLRPIPVYHPLNDGWDYFDELAQSHDRICFGNIVQASSPTRVRLLHTMWERRRQYPHLWVHALGLTANEWSLAIPADSSDSSTWLAPLRWATAASESTALRRLGDLGQPFRYSAEPGAYVHATQMLAQSVQHTADTWRLIQTRTRELGDNPHPPRMEGEGELCPST